MHILYIERESQQTQMSYSLLMQTQMSYSLLMQTQMSFPLNSVAHLFSLPAVDSLKDFPHCVLLNRVLFVTVVVSPSIAVFLSSLSLFPFSFCDFWFLKVFESGH